MLTYLHKAIASLSSSLFSLTFLLINIQFAIAEDCYKFDCPSAGSTKEDIPKLKTNKSSQLNLLDDEKVTQESSSEDEISDNESKQNSSESTSTELAESNQSSSQSSSSSEPRQNDPPSTGGGGGGGGGNGVGSAIGGIIGGIASGVIGGGGGNIFPNIGPNASPFPGIGPNGGPQLIPNGPNPFAGLNPESPLPSSCPDGKCSRQIIDSQSEQYPGSNKRKIENEECKKESYSSMGKEKVVIDKDTTIIAVHKDGDRVFGRSLTSVGGLANVTGASVTYANNAEQLQSKLTEALKKGKAVVAITCHGGPYDSSGGGIRTNSGWLTGASTANAVNNALDASGANPRDITMLDGSCYGCFGKAIEDKLKKEGKDDTINYLAASGFSEQSSIINGVPEIFTALSDSLKLPGRNFDGLVKIGDLIKAQKLLQSAHTLPGLKKSLSQRIILEQSQMFGNSL